MCVGVCRVADRKRYARSNRRTTVRGTRMAEVHDWHLFDAEAGLEARQATAEGEPNRWEVRRTGAGDDIKRLDDEQFDGLRSGRLAFEEL